MYENMPAKEYTRYFNWAITISRGLLSNSSWIDHHEVAHAAVEEYTKRIQKGQDPAMKYCVIDMLRRIYGQKRFQKHQYTLEPFFEDNHGSENQIFDIVALDNLLSKANKIGKELIHYRLLGFTQDEVAIFMKLKHSNYVSLLLKQHVRPLFKK